METEPQNDSPPASCELLKEGVKRFSLIALIVGGLIVLLTLAPLLVGVWLPDVLTGQRHTLGTVNLPDGHVFQVVQYWNRVDFYSTELYVATPDGRSKMHTLDGDDSKSWSVPITVDTAKRTVTVVLGGARSRTVDW